MKNKSKWKAMASAICLLGVTDGFAEELKVVCTGIESAITARGTRIEETFTIQKTWEATKVLELENISKVDRGLKYVVSYDPRMSENGIGLGIYHFVEKTLSFTSAATHMKDHKNGHLSFSKDNVSAYFSCERSQE